MAKEEISRNKKSKAFREKNNKGGYDYTIETIPRKDKLNTLSGRLKRLAEDIQALRERGLV